MRRRWFAAAVVAAAMGGAVPSGEAAPATYRRVSGDTFRPTEVKVSGNGRYVVFTAAPGAYGISQDNPTGEPRVSDAAQVWVTDLRTRRTELVSASIRGGGGNFESASPSVSADGRYVVFTSLADNLVPGDTNTFNQVHGWDVFVRDRKLRRTTRISLSRSGRQHTDASDSVAPAISADGSTITYYSNSNVLDDPAFQLVGYHSLYAVPRAGGPAKVKPVFLNENGSVAAWQISSLSKPDAALSATGRYVVARRDLISSRSDTEGVFVRDLKSTRVVRMPASPPYLSQGTSYPNFWPKKTGAVSMDASGTKVLAEEKIGDDKNSLGSASLGSRIVLWDLRAGTVRQVDDRELELGTDSDPTGTAARLTGDKEEASGSYAHEAVISADGRYVVYTRSLVFYTPPALQNQIEQVRDRQVFVRDLRAQSAAAAVVTCEPVPQACQSFAPSVSDNGAVVAFLTTASLEPADDPDDPQDYAGRAPSYVPAPSGTVDVTELGQAAARAQYPHDVYVRM